MGTRPLRRRGVGAGLNHYQQLAKAGAALPVGGPAERRLLRWQRWLLVSTGLLVIFGIAASFSTTVFLNIALDRPAYDGFVRHISFLLLGAVLAILTYLFIAWFAPARRWLKIVIPLVFYLSLALVALVLVPGLGKEVNGAKRFLDLGFIQF